MSNRLRSWLRFSSQDTDDTIDSSGALPLLVIFIVIGFFGILVYALQNTGDFLSVVSLGLLVAGASFVIGGLLGFLFGIPRTPEYERLQSRDTESPNRSGEQIADFRANTNLEQISDWLTKILVGVGLTQISRIPQALDKAANAVQAGLGNSPQSHVFSLAILVYFPICGFLIAYLWTRLFLPGALTRAEVNKIKERERRKAEEHVIYNVSQAIDTTAVVKGEKKLGLWVDDNPTNNAYLKQSFENLLNVAIDLSLSTDEALEKLKAKPYAFVISDMARPPDPKAGYTLLRRMRESNMERPFIIFASSAASLPANKEEALRRGAFGSTNSPQELLQLVKSALASA